MKNVTLLHTMRLAFLSVAFILVSNLAKATDYYWVGGTGVWSNLSNWATTSGGSTHPTVVPTPIDNVIFDGNSFSSSGATVTVNFQALCNNFTVTSAVGSNITFQFNSGLVSSGTISTAQTGNLTWNQASLLQAGSGVNFNKVTYNMSSGNVAITGTLGLSNSTTFTFSTSNNNTVTATTIAIDGTSTYNENSGTLTVNALMTVPSGATFNCYSTKVFNNGGIDIQAGSKGLIGGQWTMNDASFKIDPSSIATVYANNNYLYFYSTHTDTISIKSGKRDLYHVELNGSNYNSRYVLQDSLTATEGVYPYVNKFVTNGNRLFAGRFYAWSGSPTTIDFTGSDSIYVKYEFRIYPNNVTYIGGTAAIVFKNADVNGPNGSNIYFLGGGSHKFNDVIFNCTYTGGQEQILMEYGDTLHDVTFNTYGQQYLTKYDNNYIHNFTYNNRSATVSSASLPTMTVNGNNTFTGTFKYTSASSDMRPVWAFTSGNTFGTLDFTSAISEVQFGAGSVQIIGTLAAFNGSCSKKILIHSTSSGSQAILSQSSGSVTGDWVLLGDIRGQGGATYTATDATDLGNNTGWTITGVPAQKFYWVGGAGNWSDPNHWSLTSGGTAGCAIPSRIDSVFFDANSFTASGQYCTIDVTAECKNMIWNGITVGGGMNGSQNLSIYGSLKLDANMNYQHSGNLYFQSNTSSNTIQTSGKTLPSVVYFQCQNSNNGKYTLVDNLTTTNNMYIYYGKLITSGNNIAVYSINFQGSGAKLDLTGTTLVKVQNLWGIYYNDTLVMPSTCELHFEAPADVTFYSYSNGFADRKKYGKVTINSTTNNYYTQQIYGQYAHFANLNITYAGPYQFTNSLNFTSYDSLTTTFTASSNSNNNTYSFSAQGDTINNFTTKAINGVHPKLYTYYNYYASNFYLQNFAEWDTYDYAVKTYGNITVAGTCQGKTIVRGGNAGTQSTITCTGTATADNCIFKDIKTTGGGTFTSTNSVLSTNATGWSASSTGTNYYWVGGAGNWSDGNHWALTSGGASAGCYPSQVDNVFFDVNSFTAANQQVYVDITAQFKNMVWNNVNSPSLYQANEMDCYGSLAIAPNVNWNGVNWFYFDSRDTGNTINSSYKNMYYVNFRSEGTMQGGWRLVDSFLAIYYLYLDGGKFQTNGYNIQTTYLYNNNNSNAITFDFSRTRNINIYNEFQIQSNSNLIIDTATINFLYNGNNMEFLGGNHTFKNINYTIPSGAAPTIDLQGNNTINNVNMTAAGWPVITMQNNATYNDVNFTFTNTSSNIPTIGVSGSNTFNTFNVNSTGNGGPYITFNSSNTFSSLIASGLGTRLYLGASQTQTVNDVLALGNGSFPVIVNSTTTGTQARIYKPSGLVCLDYVLLKDIKGDGLSDGHGGIQTQYFAGASSVNLGDNTNWTFSSCNAFYWVGDAGNWSDYSHHWATTSGGTSFQSAAPGPNDNIFFDANSFTLSGQTVTIDVSNASCKSMRWGSAAFSPTLAGSGTLNIFGDLELINNMTQNYSGTWKFNANDTGHTINTASKSLTNVNFDSTGKWTLQNPLIVSNTINFNNGTLVTANKNITTTNFNSSSSFSGRSLQLGSSNVTINNGTWNPSTLTNTSLVEGTSTITITGNSSASFLGNGLTYNNVTFTAIPTLASTLTGGNTFNTLTISQGIDLGVSASSTQVMSSLVANGTCALPISLHSTTTGTQAIFSKSSGTDNISFLKIKDMKAQGGATFNAAYSADSGNNNGWNFTSTPTVIDALVSTTHASCLTNNNGGASVDSVIGGTKPFAYLWSNTLTTKSISSLIPGAYNVTVTDSVGCYVTKNVSVTNYPSYLVATPYIASAVNVCLGTTINFTAGSVLDTNGNAATPKSYLWNFGDFTNTTTKNPSKNYSSNGNYTVSLSYVDTNGCPAITTGAVKVSSVAESIVATNVLCNGAGNGTITITASNGVPPYLYSINNGASYVSTNSFTGLTPGTYQVKTKDSIGCSTGTQTFNITQPSAALSFTKTKTDVTCASLSNGSINITPSGGTTPYSYSINNGILYVPGSSFTNLSAGSYNVIVRDANACTAAVQTFTISVHDTTKPTITCPSNISVSASGCSQSVSVPAPAAGDECSLASVINNFNNTSDASGTYTTGVTTVIWTATDGGGNTATCSMTITVSGPVIAATGNSNPINAGDTTTAASNGTNFGNINLGNNVSHNFSINNTGTSSFIISNITMKGSSDFSFTSISLPDTIAAGHSQNINVTFMPSSLGLEKDTLTVTSTACNHNTFSFAVAGTGTCANPTRYNVTGGGNYCSGGTGVAIGLSNSQTGINYQLKQGTANIGSVVAGTGSSISFGNQTGSGSYFVVATNTVGGCSDTMTGSVTIGINPLPTVVNITGGGSYCPGGSGINVGLNSSQSGINYQLYNNSGSIGSSMAGTGSSLNFGLKTVTGNYFVVATNGSTSCTDTMSGTATINTYSLSTVYNVTGTGSYCAGGTGVTLGLSSSDTGFSYQLKYGTTSIGSPVAGTGSALNFGNETLDTTYFIVATRNTGGCIDTMSGGARVTINPLPARVITGPSSVCFGSNATLAAAIVNTHTYYIPVASLLSVFSCGTGSYYNGCGTNQPGFTWVDSGSGTPTNIQIQFGVGVECNSTGSHTYNSILNGVSGPSYASTSGWCSCSPPSTTPVVTLNFSPTGYNVGGTNTFYITNVNTCVGFYTSSSLSGYYAAITVSYPATTASGVTYVWSPGGATTDSITVSPTSTTTYKVVSTSTAGCSDSTTKTVTVNPLPTVYGVTGGGSYCPSGSGVSVGLSNSQTGINYQLMRGTTSVTTLAGTGSSLNFGNQTTTGNYFVIAANGGTGCTDTMSGSVNVSLYNLSTVYNVTGTGSYCAGGTGVTVGLSSSDTGFSYQLMNGSTTVGSPVAGTGSAISFGNQTTAATYTVVASRNIGGCTNNMSGSATVTINPLPVPVISGPSAICAGDSATYKISAQTTRIYNISLANLINLFNNCGSTGSQYNCGSNVGFSWIDSGFSTPTNIQIQFGVGVECHTGATHTSLLNGASGPSFAQTPNWCQCDNTSGSPFVTLNFTPSIYHAGSADTFIVSSLSTCFGFIPTSTLSGYYAKVTVTYGSGGSGNTYVWSPGGSTSDSIRVSPASTTTYKVVATTSFGCTDSTTKTLTVNPLPIEYAVTGGGINCTGATGVAIGLSNSESGVNYQLMMSAANIGSPHSGIGAAFSFGNFTTNGTYTVVASNATTHCMSNMSGSAAIISDTVKPTVITQNITAYLNVSGTVSITPAQIDNGSSDNCAIASRTLDIIGFNCSNEGNNTVTLTVADLVGNSQTGTAIVTVVDTVKPIVHTQNLTVYLDATGNASITPAQIDNGSTDNCSISTRTLDVSSFTCSNENMTNTVTLTVTDNSGNSQTGTATVTVLDTVKPVVHTQNLTVYLDATGNASITPTQIDNGSTDNCTISNRTLDISSFNCSNENTTNTVTLTITDNSGNSQSGTAIVTVQDTVKPVVHTQNLTVYLNATGNVSITPTQIDNGSTDNCTISSRVLDVSSFTCANENMTNTVTLTVTDNSGNSQTGTAIVTVMDTVKPTVVTQNITAYLDGTGNVSITPAQIDNGSTDNCTISNRTLDINSFTCANETTTNTVTFTVTDNSGNSQTGTAIVTVVDTVKPVVHTRNITAYLDGAGNVSITPAQIDNGSTDNCSISSRTLDVSNFTCSNENMTNTVTLTVTDNSDNSQTGTAIVTVVDTVKPVVHTQNLTVYLDGSGHASITPDQVNNGSTDNCTIASKTLDVSSFSCSNENMTNTVTLTVADNSGNSQTGTATITVLDTLKPVVHTQNITVYLDGSGHVTITPAQIDNGSTDNCTISNRTLDISSFTCANESTTNTVTLTVTDNSGNSQTGTATVTVVDTVKPVVHTQNLTVYLNASGSASITPSQIDNGSTDNCAIASRTLNKTSFNCSNEGANTVTLTVTDNSGNSQTGTAIVTVVDTVKPVVHTQNLTVYLNASGTASITPAQIDNGSTDNCAIASRTLDKTSFNCSNEGGNTVTLTVTDNSGNIKTGTATITVVDTTRPTVTTKNKTIYLSATGTASIVVADIDNGSTDNCTIASRSLSKTNFNCSNKGTNTVTLSVTDNSGNMGANTATVTVLDTLAPIISCPGNKTIACNTVPSNTGTATATDNCDVSPVITYSDVSTYSAIVTDSAHYNYIITRTWTATDASGNHSNCTQVITVHAFNVSAAITQIPCHDNDDAAIELSVSGGIGTLSYSWSNGSTTKNIYDLSANNYTVTITDINGCTYSNTWTITNPSRIYVSGTAINVSCHGGTNGSITSSITGGNAPYTYRWSNGATTANISGLSKGNYHLTVTDVHGCSQDEEFDVDEPSAIDLSASTTGTSCYGSSNGSINLSVSGGTSPYTYSWSNGAHTQDISSLAAGTYTVTVTDAHGCNQTATYIVTQPTVLVLNASVDSVSCNGGNDGHIDIDATGGSGGYSYVWSSGTGHSDDFNGPAGTYSVNVTDENGCTASATYTIYQPTAITITGIVTNARCYQGETGAIDITVTGGAGGYTYSWSDAGGGHTYHSCSSWWSSWCGSHSGTPSSHSQDLSNIEAGTYTVTVTDRHGCSSTATYTVTQPTQIAITATQTNVTCSGSSNGTISITVAGGTGSTYSYSWSNGAHTQNISGLSAGTYTVTVTDANGCTNTGSYTITAPSTISLSAVTTNASCHGGASGAINLSVSGGTSGYSYTWSNGAHTQDISGLSAGTYTVTVTDVNGCIASASYTVTQPAAITLSATSTNVSCNGGNNGAVNLTVSGGTGSYRYNWSNGEDERNISGLSAGTYTVTVTDANGCTQTGSYTITQPSAIVLSATTTNTTCHGGSNGAINLSASGGTGSTYSYNWSNGAHTQNVSSLSAGTYSVTVTDANGCTQTGSYTIIQPSAVTASITVNPVYAVSPGGLAYTLYIGYGPKSDSLKASGSGGTGALSYSWSPSSTLSSASVAAVKATPTATTTYTVTVTDANGCTATRSQMLTLLDVRCSDNHKVEICHHTNGDHYTTLCVDSSSVAGYLASGDYLGGCGSDNARIVTNNEPPTDFNIDVYPNPNTGTFKVMIPPTNGSIQVQIIDMTGKMVASKTIQDGKIEQIVDFNLNDIVRGLYFVKVIANDKAYIKKVIIQ